MQERELVVLNYDGVADHIYNRILELGYVPTSNEVIDIVDIVYEYLVNLLDFLGLEYIEADVDYNEVYDDLDEWEEDE